MQMRALGSVLSVLLMAAPASAALINFEDRTGPSLFANATAETLNYTNIEGTGVDVQITGGGLLDQTANLPANQSTVYGTASFATGFANTVTLTFSSAITNFFLDVYNGQTTDVQYIVSDNAGHSAVFTLVPNTSSGSTLVGFAATGAVVTITPVGSPATWDFFVDNIRFNEPLPPDIVPGNVSEPTSLLLLGFGLAGVLRRVRSRRSR